MTSPLLWTLFLASTLTPSQSRGDAEKRVLTVEDYFRNAELDDPQLSPDGTWIAYTVTTNDLEADKSTTRIWMVPSDGSDEAVPMTAESSSASAPRFSPDGKYLAFLAARGDQKTQVWALFRHGGEAQPITTVDQGVSSYAWSPDGDRLALVVKDPDPNQEDTPKTPKPWVINRLQFKRDYEGYLDRRRTHIYTFDVQTKELTQVTSGDYDDSAPAWSPDGERIAFVSNRTAEPDANYNTDIFTVSADGSNLVKLSRNPGEDRSPVYSPSGDHIAYVSAVDTDALVYVTYDLAIQSADGGPARNLTASVDRMVSRPRFSPDGKFVYFLMENEGASPLARVAPTGGDVETFLQPDHTIESFTIAHDGKLATLESTSLTPGEIFFDGSQRTFTNKPLLDELSLGPTEEIQFPSADGTPIEAFVVKPPDFEPGRRYPTLLRIHGGPVSQYDARFHYEAQLFAANGYVVVMPNPRGSSGYGQDFARAIWQGWGDKDYEDVLAAVDHTIELGYTDRNRTGVFGWSYGGLLTNHIITKTDRFQAAITGASSTLYVANYGHDQYQRWWVGELGPPWEPESRALWEELSPFNRVDRVTTPTLIVGGEKDWNVPILNSEQLYQALKRLGRTTELVVYPGEFHSISTPSYVKDLYERYLSWFGKYVKGEGKASE